MASNKGNRPSKPKTEGEKHQGVGVNPKEYKGHALGANVNRGGNPKSKRSSRSKSSSAR